MKNPYAKVMTIAKLETEGAWVPFEDMDTQVKVARMGGARNTAYLKVVAERMTAIGDIDTGDEDEDNRIATEMMSEIFAEHIIKDWRVKDEKGEWVNGIYVLEEDDSKDISDLSVTIEEATPERILSILDRMPDFRQMLMNAAQDITTFQTNTTDAIAKN